MNEIILLIDKVVFLNKKDDKIDKYKFIIDDPRLIYNVNRIQGNCFWGIYNFGDNITLFIVDKLKSPPRLINRKLCTSSTFKDYPFLVLVEGPGLIGLDNSRILRYHLLESKTSFENPFYCKLETTQDLFLLKACSATIRSRTLLLLQFSYQANDRVRSLASSHSDENGHLNRNSTGELFYWLAIDIDRVCRFCKFQALESDGEPPQTPSLGKGDIPAIPEALPDSIWRNCRHFVDHKSRIVAPDTIADLPVLEASLHCTATSVAYSSEVSDGPRVAAQRPSNRHAHSEDDEWREGVRVYWGDTEGRVSSRRGTRGPISSRLLPRSPTLTGSSAVDKIQVVQLAGVGFPVMVAVRGFEVFVLNGLDLAVIQEFYNVGRLSVIQIDFQYKLFLLSRKECDRIHLQRSPANQSSRCILTEDHQIFRPEHTFTNPLPDTQPPEERPVTGGGRWAGPEGNKKHPHASIAGENWEEDAFDWIVADLLPSKITEVGNPGESCAIDTASSSGRTPHDRKKTPQGDDLQVDVVPNYSSHCLDKADDSYLEMSDAPGPSTSTIASPSTTASLRIETVAGVKWVCGPFDTEEAYTSDNILTKKSHLQHTLDSLQHIGRNNYKETEGIYSPLTRKRSLSATDNQQEMEIREDRINNAADRVVSDSIRGLSQKMISNPLPNSQSNKETINDEDLVKDKGKKKKKSKKKIRLNDGDGDGDRRPSSGPQILPCVIDALRQKLVKIQENQRTLELKCDEKVKVLHSLFGNLLSLSKGFSDSSSEAVTIRDLQELEEYCVSFPILDKTASHLHSLALNNRSSEGQKNINTAAMHNHSNLNNRISGHVFDPPWRRRLLKPRVYILTTEYRIQPCYNGVDSTPLMIVQIKLKNISNQPICGVQLGLSHLKTTDENTAQTMHGRTGMIPVVLPDRNAVISAAYPMSHSLFSLSDKLSSSSSSMASEQQALTTRSSDELDGVYIAVNVYWYEGWKETQRSQSSPTYSEKSEYSRTREYMRAQEKESLRLRGLGAALIRIRFNEIIHLHNQNPLRYKCSLFSSRWSCPPFQSAKLMKNHSTSDYFPICLLGEYDEVDGSDLCQSSSSVAPVTSSLRVLLTPQSYNEAIVKDENRVTDLELIIFSKVNEVYRALGIMDIDGIDTPYESINPRESPTPLDNLIDIFYEHKVKGHYSRVLKFADHQTSKTNDTLGENMECRFQRKPCILQLSSGVSLHDTSSVNVSRNGSKTLVMGTLQSLDPHVLLLTMKLFDSYLSRQHILVVPLPPHALYLSMLDVFQCLKKELDHLGLLLRKNADRKFNRSDKKSSVMFRYGPSSDMSIVLDESTAIYHFRLKTDTDESMARVLHIFANFHEIVTL